MGPKCLSLAVSMKASWERKEEEGRDLAAPILLINFSSNVLHVTCHKFSHQSLSPIIPALSVLRNKEHTLMSRKSQIVLEGGVKGWIGG
jgi:hypothetical protein